LPDGLAIFLSGTANLKRMQPAIFVSAIRARHLIVIIFSLGRSLRFAQNNRGFVEKLSQPLPKNGFQAEVLPAREHRSGWQTQIASNPLPPGYMLFNRADKFTGAANRGGHGMRIKSVEQIYEH
jgi:hypothetical protein